MGKHGHMHSQARVVMLTDFSLPNDSKSRATMMHDNLACALLDWFIDLACSLQKDRSTSTQMGSVRAMARAEALRAPPAWMELLLAAIFFQECPVHPDTSGATRSRSGGCNLFCTTCTERSLCSGCVAAGEHDGHTIIQVRKTSGYNCVKLKGIDSLLGTGEVQPYLHNDEQVVFLDKRLDGKKRKAGEYRCMDTDCDRALIQKDYRFCSLGCKKKCMKDDLRISFAVPKDDTKSSNGMKSGEEALSWSTKRRRGS
ncbi:hypothetical protein EJB05_24664, partial [Eragrostis curvula]